jgi:DNA-binding beta-propeller fold protein YncE
LDVRKQRSLSFGKLLFWMAFLVACGTAAFPEVTGGVYDDQGIKPDGVRFSWKPAVLGRVDFAIGRGSSAVKLSSVRHRIFSVNPVTLDSLDALDTESLKVLDSVSLPGTYPHSVALSEATGRVFVAFLDGFNIVDGDALELVSTESLGCHCTVMGALANPVTDHIYFRREGAFGSELSDMAAYDAASGSLIGEVFVVNRHAGALNLATNRLYLGARQWVVNVIPGDTFDRKYSLYPPASSYTRLFEVAVDSMTNRIFVAAGVYYPLVVFAINGETEDFVANIPIDDRADWTGEVFSTAPDSGHLYMGRNGTVHVIDTHLLKVTAVLELGDFVKAAAFVPEDGLIYFQTQIDEAWHTVVVKQGKRHRVVAVLPGGANYIGADHRLGRVFTGPADDGSLLVLGTEKPFE